MRMILGVILLMKLMTKETDAKFFLVEIADNDVSKTRVDLGMSRILNFAGYPAPILGLFF